MDNMEKQWIELFQSLGKANGWDNLTSTILAILYIEPKEVAMDRLARETGYSLASICNKIRAVETMGFVKRITKPGTKKVFLYMEKDLFKIWRDHLIRVERSKIKIVKEKLPLILKEKAHKEKKEILQNYYKQVLKFEGIVQDMIKRLDNE